MSPKRSMMVVLALLWASSVLAMNAWAQTLQNESEPSQTQQYKEGQAFQDCDVCPVMIVIPPGRYKMGSRESEVGRVSDEDPRHDVTIAYRFAVGKYEITFDEWEACVNGGGCNGHRPDDAGWGRGNRPVINVSWEDAHAYAAWLSNKTGAHYRLLSESEWEYVARAGMTTPFHFGTTISTEQANYNGNYTYGWGSKGIYRQQTVPVGSFPANDFGLHDVHGNVWEWVEDCSNTSYAGAPTNGAAMTQGHCSMRILRGGSWDDRPRALRSALRFRSTTRYRGVFTGIRIARAID